MTNRMALAILGTILNAFMLALYTQQQETPMNNYMTDMFSIFLLISVISLIIATTTDLK